MKDMKTLQDVIDHYKIYDIEVVERKIEYSDSEPTALVAVFAYVGTELMYTAFNAKDEGVIDSLISACEEVIEQRSQLKSCVVARRGSPATVVLQEKERYKNLLPVEQCP